MSRSRLTNSYALPVASLSRTLKRLVTENRWLPFFTWDLLTRDPQSMTDNAVYPVTALLVRSC